ncbi:MAG: magnesium-translocating P-type ATPase, partial [Myxococcaceae bacterium]
PADARLLEAHDLFVNQSSLTGEPFPVEKQVLPAGGPEQPAEARHCVYLGTSVISGSGTAVVYGIGEETAMGAAVRAFREASPSAAFEREIRSFSLLLMRITLLLVLFVMLANTVLHRPLLEALLFAAALAVGLTPELLPVIVTVTLSRGALRMSRQHVIVKRLSAIHDLGSMDILCSDKTGTLTEAKIRLERHEDLSGRDSARVLELAYLNSTFESGLLSPMDEAILAHGEVDASGWRKVDEVPFDFERRRVSVLIERDGRRLLIVKGAPEEILSHCTRQGTREVLLDEDTRARVLARFEALGEEGFRVLAVASREAPDLRTAEIPTEGLVLEGLAAFLDPPRQDASAALQALSKRGVSMKLVTGDNERVALHVFRELGMPVEAVLTGHQIDQLDDHALGVRSDQTNIFARVSPAQKSRVILALRRRGHVVGYLGDGINDAPSLHSADVGITVEGAADVAREAADLLLLRHDLAVLHDGVIEGRRTFGNILKYLLMGTSSNFGNMISMAGASAVLPFLPMRPVQVLLNNLLYDLSEMAIPLDKVEEDTLARPPRWNLKFLVRFMIVVGLVSSCFDAATFAVLLWGLRASETLFHTSWFAESLTTQVLVVFVIRTRHSPFASRPSVWLTLTCVAVVIIGNVLPFTPLAPAVGFVRPPLVLYPIIAGLTLSYLFCVELIKRRFFRRFA